MTGGDPEVVYDDLEGRTFRLGPTDEPYWKFRLAQYVFWLVRTGPWAPLIVRVPGAERAGLWAFEVAVLSRDVWEVDDGE